MPFLRSHCTLLSLSVPTFFPKVLSRVVHCLCLEMPLLVDVNALLRNSVNAIRPMKAIASLSNSMGLKRTKSLSRGHMQ